MERFTHAYGRALFPNRYRPRAGAGTRAADRQVTTIAPGGLDLAIGAGVYRLVNAVEGLLDALGQRIRRRRAGRQRPLAATRVGCG